MEVGGEPVGLAGHTLGEPPHEREEVEETEDMFDADSFHQSWYGLGERHPLLLLYIIIIYIYIATGKNYLIL